MIVHVLYDWNDSHGTAASLVSSGLVDLGCPLVENHFTPPSRFKLWSWLVGAVRVLMKSSNGDVIVTWYDFQGILCFLVSKLLFRKREFVIINLLLKDKSTMKNRLVSWLYKITLTAKNVRASVTSEAYGRMLNQKLGNHLTFPVVRDVYFDSYSVSTDTAVRTCHYVFCGGSNARDWDFMFSVTRNMPDVMFHFVMRRDDYQRYKDIKALNVVIKVEIPEDEFIREVAGCSLCALPLQTNAPAGLIVLFMAGMQDKVVLITKTLTSAEYITNERGEPLENHVDSWCDSIRHYLDNPDIANKKGKRLHQFIENECSPKSFCRGILQMIESLA
ncbi:MAG: hypothetical protein IKH01_07655 [Prevotella sp.]|nr:hypothetical protein [Prevotella sp.]